MKNDINLKDFKLNEEGSFSITRPFESLQIINLISNFIKYYDEDLLSNKVITDATACVGGDLIRFSKCFKCVNGVEVFEENFKILNENCIFFRCNNVNLYHVDYIDVYDKLVQDVIYFDPQWGGRNYKTKESIILKLGSTELWNLILQIKDKNLAKYIFIKAPINVCLNNLEYDSIHIIYNKSKVPSFKLICIKI